MTVTSRPLPWNGVDDAAHGLRPVARLISDREQSMTERRRMLLAAMPTPSALSGDVARLLQLIHERAFEPRTSVKTLRSAGAARDHNVSSRFKTEIGIGIGGYITTLRVHTAVRLLRVTNWSIAEISYTVGYEYLQTFYRDFRKIAGSTPGEMRRPPLTDDDACRSA